jgi:hypothetical protein
MKIIYDLKDNNWPIGFSWTKGGIVSGWLPDGAPYEMQIHGGLFFWLP